MTVEVKTAKRWQPATHLVGADAASDVQAFAAAVAQRLHENGFTVRIRK